MSQAYVVTLRVTGTVTFNVRADSPEQAESQALDRLHGGEDTDADSLESLGVLRVQELPPENP